MKWRHLILWTLGGLVVLGGAGTALALRYEADCADWPDAGAAASEAAVHTCYGGPEVVQHVRVEKPAPGPGEVLVRVRAAAVNPLDWHYLRGKPYVMRAMGAGIGRPADPRLGVDFAGDVEAVGEGVTKFRPGDAVFGGRTGAFAQYVVVGQDRAVVRKPATASYAEAAAIPIAGVTALQALRDHGRVESGDRVLINGASGGVGTFAVQIARSLGAEVTGVCSTRNVVLVKSIGAHRVIDYTKSDYTRSGEQWDVIIDLVGNHPIAANRDVLREDGRLVLVGGGDGDWIGPFIGPASAALQNAFAPQELTSMLARLHQPDLKHLAGLLASGQLTAVIDRHYPLADVAKAIGHSETGRARGKIIVDIP